MKKSIELTAGFAVMFVVLVSMTSPAGLSDAVMKNVRCTTWQWVYCKLILETNMPSSVKTPPAKK